MMDATFLPRSPQVVSLWHQASPEGRRVLEEMHQHYANQFRPYDGVGIAPESVAFTLQSMVDRSIRKLQKEKEAKRISCRKGCDHCCHLNVRMTAQEASRLRAHMLRAGITIDEARLERQAALGDDIGRWHDLPKAERRCVFLSNGSCRAYEARPMACRKYFVTSDPSKCDTEKQLGAEVKYMVAYEAEVVFSAALEVFESGSMAVMLLQTRSAVPGSAAPQGKT